MFTLLDNGGNVFNCHLVLFDWPGCKVEDLEVELAEFTVEGD